MDPDRAAGWFSRYLRAHGLPGCTVDPGSGNFLGRIRFAPVPAAADGPLVSVVIPAHRTAATLGYAIDSILAQTYRNLEVLVGDDASGDGTLTALLATRRAVDPRVRIFTSSANQGPYNLRNLLVDQARGELLAFHDADDLAVPTRIATQVDRLRGGRGPACYGCWIRVGADGRVYFFHDRSPLRLCLASLVIERAAFTGLGGFRGARFGADLELYERLRDRHGDLPVVRQPLVLGLWSPASATRAAGFEALEDGYRSPARRAYAELVFRQLLEGRRDDGEIERMLRDTGNRADPAPITGVDRRTPGAAPGRGLG